MCQCEQCGRNYADHRPKGPRLHQRSGWGCSGFCSEAGTLIRASPILDRSSNDFEELRLINRAARRPGTVPVSLCTVPQGGAVLYFDGFRHMFSTANT
jgi:hypothetical protein